MVGMALKLARVVTGNSKVVSLWDSFHGASLDAISVGGEACFRQGMGPLMAGVERIPPPIIYRGAFPLDDNSDVHYADYLEYVIEKKVASVLLLPKGFVTPMFKCHQSPVGNVFVRSAISTMSC